VPVMSQRDYTTLPGDLPIPRDDGACRHLAGMQLPAIALQSTAGTRVDLSSLSGTITIYCYPMTGVPGVPLPPGWDQIPGARGCTPESCGFRNHFEELRELSAQVYGLSTQSTEYQRELVGRLALPFEILSDSELAFTRALRLPMFQAQGLELIKRLTLIVRNGMIQKVFYPIFPPDRHAEEVVEWLRRP
jgi:peroxiredoxin